MSEQTDLSPEEFAARVLEEIARAIECGRPAALQESQPIVNIQISRLRGGLHRIDRGLLGVLIETEDGKEEIEVDLGEFSPWDQPRDLFKWLPKLLRKLSQPDSGSLSRNLLQHFADCNDD